MKIIGGPVLGARAAHGVQPLEAAPGRLRGRAGGGYPDLDGRDLDPDTRHVVMEDDDGVVLGCARVLDEGDTWRIGRVALHPTVRGHGPGRRADGDRAAGLPGPRRRARRPVPAGRLVRRRSASRSSGEEFLEDGIPHLPMRLRRMKVRLGAGTGVEWLMAAMAVADPDWRAVLTHGETAYAAALAAGGRTLVRDAGRIGRHGWIRLLGPLTRVRGAWSVEALRTSRPAGRRRAARDPHRSRRPGRRVAGPRRPPRTCGAPACACSTPSPPPPTRAPVLTRVRARLAEVGPRAAARRGRARAALRARRARRRRAGDLAPGGADRGRARPSPTAP